MMADGTTPGETGAADERLRLVLLSAHPSLPREAAAALTLRLVLGVPTADIARLFWSRPGSDRHDDRPAHPRPQAARRLRVHRADRGRAAIAVGQCRRDLT